MERLLLYAALLFFTSVFVKNLCSFLFGMDNYRTTKKRESQLDKFGEKQGSTLDEKLDKITGPANKYILPKIAVKEEELRQDLALIGWDKHFTPKTFTALLITIKIAAVILGLLFSLIHIFFGLIIGGMCFITLDVYFKAEVSDRKAAILEEFPTFLRITQGFLSSNHPLVVSLEDTLPYLSEEWQKLISVFISDYNFSGIKTALEHLKNSTGLFEVRKFVALLNLALEQNIDVKEGFAMQAEAITEMQQFINAKKLNKRKNLSILIQAPMMIAILLAFGLPIIGDMTAVGMF